MKILIIKSNLTEKENKTLVDGLFITSTHLNSIGFNHEYTIKTSDTKFTTLPLLTIPGEYQISPNEIYLEEKKFGDYDVVCLIYNPKGIKNPPVRPTENAEFIQMPTTWFANYPEVFAEFLLHELCHERFYALKLPDITHNFYSTEFKQMSDGPIKFYLSLLSKMKPKTGFIQAIKEAISPVKQYKYFSASEVSKWGLKPELWALLDKMREECGFPFIINSGLRTKAENDKLKDSASDSAHLSGLACDLRITNSSQRFKLVEVALKNGITRIGVSFNRNFVHIDIDKTKPQNVMWTYK